MLPPASDSHVHAVGRKIDVSGLQTFTANGDSHRQFAIVRKRVRKPVYKAWRDVLNDKDRRREILWKRREDGLQDRGTSSRGTHCDDPGIYRA